MDLRPLPSRQLVAYARAEAFSDNTLIILARLGYRIFSPDGRDILGMGRQVVGAEVGVSAADRLRPELYLVDEHRLREVPAATDGTSVPIIVLTGSRGASSADSRIVGALKRPGGLHDLYRMLQQVFEDTPRSTPRIPTRLAAVCRRSGHEWNASVLSLSENGCLLRTPEPVPLGTELQLAFELPTTGTIRVAAETAYQLVPDLGLVFSATPARIRESISCFVRDSLLADPATAASTR